MALGHSSNVSGQYAAAIGFNSEASKQNATALGSNSNAMGQNSTAIGYDAQATKRNTIIIGNSDAKVGIGTSDPTAKLHVNGTFRYVDGSQGTDKVLTSDANGNATSIFNIPIPNANRKLQKVTDLLGRETKGKKNQPLFYIYDDGTVEKRVVID